MYIGGYRAFIQITVFFTRNNKSSKIPVFWMIFCTDVAYIVFDNIFLFTDMIWKL